MYVLVFDKAIRIGTEVSKLVGPFNSIAEASKWYAELHASKQVPSLPDVTVEFMIGTSLD